MKPYFRYDRNDEKCVCIFYPYRPVFFIQKNPMTQHKKQSKIRSKAIPTACGFQKQKTTHIMKPDVIKTNKMPKMCQTAIPMNVSTVTKFRISDWDKHQKSQKCH